jgi:raffinose synthase
MQVFVLIFYQFFVDPAGPNSWSVSVFRSLARGPLKSGMMSFFKVSGDFTKRLISVKANGKFSNVDAGDSQRAWFAEAEDFRVVVNDFKRRFGVRYVYCWHGFAAYWGGVVPTSADFSDLESKIVFPEPTAGVREVEPAMLWNPAVIAGIGVVNDAEGLYRRMHTYLAQSGVDGVKARFPSGGSGQRCPLIADACVHSSDVPLPLACSEV